MSLTGELFIKRIDQMNKQITLLQESKVKDIPIYGHLLFAFRLAAIAEGFKQAVIRDTLNQKQTYQVKKQ